jgi:hypothetical protein
MPVGEINTGGYDPVTNASLGAINTVANFAPKPAATSSRRRRTTTSKNGAGYSSGRGSGYSGGGGGGGYSVGATKGGTVTTAAPPPMNPQQFLAKDSTYLNQQKAYQQALADYAAQYQAEIGKYGNEYNASVDKVGQERDTGLSGLKDDYASRGMITSGVYGDAVNKYNTDIDTKLADLLRGKTAYENDLSTSKTNFTKEQQALLDKAKQDALNRQLAGM